MDTTNTRHFNGEAQVGAWVTYEDMANPRRTFEVVEVIDDRWGRQYRVQDVDSDESRTSDLRQHGWTFAQ